MKKKKKELGTLWTKRNCRRETPLFLKRKREEGSRRRRKKEREKKGEGEEEEEEKFAAGADDEANGFDDPFFAQEPDANFDFDNVRDDDDDTIVENKKKSKKKKQGSVDDEEDAKTKAELELPMMDENVILGRGDAQSFKKNKSLAKTTKDGEEKVTRKTKKARLAEKRKLRGKAARRAESDDEMDDEEHKKTSRKPLTSKMNDLVLSLKTTSLRSTQLILGTKTSSRKHSLRVNVRNAARRNWQNLRKFAKRCSRMVIMLLWTKTTIFLGVLVRRKDLPAVSEKMSWIR